MPRESKYKGLSVLERVDPDSSNEARNTPFPIASISKSFCGAVCALMSAGGEFGDNGIDTTLQEVLESAKTQHPARAEKIDEYQQMLQDRGFGDVTISELLTHRSGCKDADELAPSACKGQSPLEFFSDHLGRGGNLGREECKRGEHRYSNVGYTLLEEVINLTSVRAGGYKQELQDRIVKPLGLQNTGLLEDKSDAKSQEADLHLGRAVFIPGSKENPHSDKIVQVLTEFPANHTAPLGAVHASCGGLYSSVDDLQKFSQELGKMVTGQANSLTNKPEIVSGLYRRQLGDSNHYSLGVEVEFANAQECVMKHTGLFPGNFASMAVLMPCSFDQLRSDIKIDGEPKTNVFMQKNDYLVSSLFTEKAETVPAEILKEFVNSKLTEEEKTRFAGAKSGEAEKFLIENERLPENFAETRKVIFDSFKPASARVKEFLKDNYLKEDGVIDSAKIAEEFQTVAAVDKAIGPMFEEERAAAANILSELSQSLSTHEKSESTTASRDVKGIGQSNEESNPKTTAEQDLQARLRTARAEIHGSVMPNLEEELGIGDQQHTPESKAIRQARASKIPGKRLETSGRDL